MSEKVEERRKVLRDELISVAKTTIAADSHTSLRARKLAAQAGCAVGAIYNIFDDLNDLVIAVNQRTFKALILQIDAAQTDGPQKPTDQLIWMAQAYHNFAVTHQNLWHALFDVARPQEVAEMEKLLSHFQAPLAALNPHMADDALRLLSKAVFASVHGIVLIGLGEVDAGRRGDDIDAMISLILKQMTASKSLW